METLFNIFTPNYVKFEGTVHAYIIPDELDVAIKIRAANEHIKTSALIIKAVEAYLGTSIKKDIAVCEKKESTGGLFR